MKLLDRYLHAVRTHLPKAEQDDIIKELSENIQSQVDDREAELGRELNECEQEAILKQHGRPMLVAGRYRQRQYLIGPAMFGYYWFTLKITLLVVACVYAWTAYFLPFLASVLEIAGAEPPPETLRILGMDFPVAGWVALALALFGLITLVFVVLEVCQNRFHFLDRWNPRSLQPVPMQAPSLLDPRPIPRSLAILGLAAQTVFIVWWLNLPRFPLFVFGPGASVLKLTSVWQSFLVPVLLLKLVGVAYLCVELFRPQWTRVRLFMRIATRCGSVVIFYVLFKAGDWVMAADATNRYSAHRLVDLINVSVSFGFLIGLLGSAIVLAWEWLPYVPNLLRRERHRVAGI